MRKLAVFASGSGTNFQAILDAIEKGKLNAEVALLVCDKPNAFAIERAKKHNIEVFQFIPKNFENKQAFEKVILQQLQDLNVEWIFLAGYMRLIGETLLEAYEGRIVNIHPSLLPSFPGKDAIEQAYEAKVKVSGVTIHFVDAGMDTGPIIAQAPIYIEASDTLEDVRTKIQEVEHRLYPEVIDKLLNEVEREV
ncbi:phosphoribosylglycinamide formyltransferase [Anaerobacillus isosaccharinicus]|uniref:Phosphoribosylglycinamide formyltransferase n=1 Tax=Anaerobacillus isosaccharinicus TaxID=1532552 RepID=A0A7S7RD88_9BACI|nr:phosphoribosylglycinamide formyltransferase [Anaerobacillus isosaccharinicus]MBA5588768.1 phosphoribosylglycinamide formyltransferase [Anaerobacillus isosaccharinicus]QOY37834.1 phosphoribosylglycinamide formyltransferase [Anaerobacillus isosaccharinicus]